MFSDLIPYLVSTWIWAALGVFLILAGLVAIYGMPYTRLLQAGIDQLKKKEFEAAAYCFQQAAEMKPTRWMPRDYLARARLGQGKVHAALESFEEAARLDPRKLRSRLGLGLCLIKTDQYTRAAEILEAIAEEKPDLREVHVALGETYVALQRFDKAREAYLRSASPGTSRPEMLYGLAIVCLGRGEKEQAKGYLREILKGDPGHRDARLTLAAVARDEGRPEEALEICEEAVEQDPAVAESWLALGITMTALHRWADARAPLEKALGLQPKLGGAHFHLARVQAKLGEAEAALEALRQSLKRGFPSRAMIEGDEAFEGLRGSDDFRELLDRARKDAP